MGEDWRAARGGALRSIAARLETETGMAEDGLLRDTDTLVCREAARRYAGVDMERAALAIRSRKHKHL